MRFADSIAASAGSFTPGLTIDWSRARLRGVGTYTQLANSGWSTQGSVDLSLFTPTVHTLSGELAASSGGSAHWDGTRTAQSTAIARAHVDANDGGVWAGGGLGQAWDGFASRALVLGDAGAWLRSGPATVVATMAPTQVGDTVRYIDSEMSAHWSGSAIELLASAGFRAGDRFAAVGTNPRTWGSASIVTHVTARVGIVFSAGTYPVDLAEGFPGGRYLMLNFRLSTPKASPRATLPALGDRSGRRRDASSTTILALELTVASGERRNVRVRAPTAHSVEINGDFTGWKPLLLSSRGAGWWQAPVSLGTGTYQCVIRIDGGAWEVPPQLLTVTDEFGGAAGLLIVK
jgi:hypothetical protein